MKTEYDVKKFGIGKMPREKMIDGQVDEMNLSELVAVLIGKGNKNESVFTISERIINDYGSKTLLKEKDPKKLNENLKIGEVNSCKLIAAFELGRRFYSSNARSRTLIRGPEDVFEYTKDMSTLVKEHFRGLYLNTKNYVIHDEIISIGHLSGALVHPREVFKAAVEFSASSLIVVHNHPSGDPEPSKNDDKITKMLKEAGNVMNIPMTDHVIVGEDSYYSYNEKMKI
ncbi:MAG: DNA repair protein RadC [Candidatus Delongbacteria bacterium]|jgi:DNA repair protein RadC|nr:DNA repair protein RadC [Candidatus Delongbacteria bacterium]